MTERLLHRSLYNKGPGRVIYIRSSGFALNIRVCICIEFCFFKQICTLLRFAINSIFPPLSVTKLPSISLLAHLRFGALLLLHMLSLYNFWMSFTCFDVTTIMYQKIIWSLIYCQSNSYSWILSTIDHLTYWNVTLRLSLFIEK